ncbi:MAG: tRNA (guanosine(37)-N1)-methyltransferase TrmD [Patescibacteria group bacterium]
MKNFKVLTIFPGIISNFFSKGVIFQAIKTKKIKIDEVNLRDFAFSKHQVTDDKQFGGGPGQVMKIEPIYFALEKIYKNFFKKNTKGRIKTHYNKSLQNLIIKKSKKPLSRLSKKMPLIIGLDASGKKFNQKMAKKLSEFDEIVLICGRYQGIDQRVLDNFTDLNLCVGDTIYSGGEVAAVSVIDSISRLIPEVLGNNESLLNETFSNGNYPLYTQPREFLGLKVPEILFSGHHKKIDEFRKRKNKNLKK